MSRLNPYMTYVTYVTYMTINWCYRLRVLGIGNVTFSHFPAQMDTCQQSNFATGHPPFSYLVLFNRPQLTR